MLKDILASCAEIAQQVDDREIRTLMAEADSAVNGQPCLGIADMNGVDRSALQAAGLLCGSPLPEGLLNCLRQTPACMTIENGSSEGLLRMTAEGAEPIDPQAECLPEDGPETAELVCCRQDATLEDHRLMLCSGVTDMDTWKKLLAHIDVLCIRVNATVAMTQSEKRLIGLLAGRFDGSPVAVWLDRQDRLNSEEDLACVKESIRGAFERAGRGFELFSTAEETMLWMERMRLSDDLEEKRLRRVLRGLLMDMSGRIAQMIEEGRSAGQNTDEILGQLNKRRNYLKLAGRAASSSVLTEAFNSIKYEIHEAMRDYSGQMVEQICSRIATVDSAELERLPEQIRRYQARSWELYQQNLERQLEKEYDEIFQRVMKRMEDDAGELYAQMDAAAVDGLCRSIGLSAGRGGCTLLPEQELSEMEQLRKETRNMMLLAVPALLVSVPLALTTLVGARVYQSVSVFSAEESFRKKLADAVRVNAANELELLTEHVDARVDSAMKQSAENVQQAYGRIIDILTGRLTEAEENRRRLAEQTQRYEELVGSRIPELLARLNG